MDISTLAGLIVGIGFIIFGIMMGGKLGNFYDMPSILITLGGTTAAILIAFPFAKIIQIPKLFAKAFLTQKIDLKAGIDSIIELAQIARREGILALEERSYEIDDPFLQKGILLIVDGTEPELVRNILETELSFLEERHKQGRGILESAGSFAPAFGMIGTLIGLINMLKHLSQPDKLGPSMAVALITTFYGSLLANLLFLPMAAKLKQRSEEEVLLKEIYMEGALSMQAGENPRVIEEKLIAFLPPDVRKKAEGQAEEKVEEANVQA